MELLLTNYFVPWFEVARKNAEKTGGRFWYRIIEFTLLALVMTTIMILKKWGAYMFLFLWGSTIYCAIVYLRSPEARGMVIWRWSEVTKQHLRPIFTRWIVATIFLIGFISVYDPDRRFDILLHRTDVWVRVMLLYPLLSALPQEFIFCTFFFWRYSFLFPNHRKMMAAVTFVFAYVHVIFINPVAPLLTLIAGYFFSGTYAKHKSLALVTIEHALYGNMLFTLGLGWYFWGGALH